VNLDGEILFRAKGNGKTLRWAHFGNIHSQIGKIVRNLRHILLTEVNLARCWWLRPIILATEEAEIRRIVVQNQLRQIVQKTLS
jgi:hypothetical protein